MRISSGGGGICSGERKKMMQQRARVNEQRLLAVAFLWGRRGEVGSLLFDVAALLQAHYHRTASTVNHSCDPHFLTTCLRIVWAYPNDALGTRVAQARGLLSVYKTWVFYTLTYAQTVVAFLMARACREITNVKIQDLVAKPERRHQDKASRSAWLALKMETLLAGKA
jgi:hypothetical protein